MKKTLLLSVVASTMIMAGGDIAPVEPVVVAEELSAWEFGGDMVAYTQTRDNYNVTNRWPDSYVLGSETSLFDSHGTSGLVGLSLRAANKDLFAGIGIGAELTALGNGYNNGYSASNFGLQEGDALTQGYLTYGMDSISTSLKVGRQHLPKSLSPFAFTEGWQAVKNSFDAALVVNSSLPNTTLVYAYVAQANRSVGELSDFSKIGVFGDAVTAEDGVHMVTAQNKSIDGLTLTGTWYIAPSMTSDALVIGGGDVNILWGDAAFAAESFGVAVQGGQITPDGLDNTTAFGAKVTGNLGMFDLLAAYSSVDDGTVNVENLGTNVKTPLYTQAIANQDAIKRDSDSLKLAAGMKALGGKFGLAYMYSDLGDTANNSTFTVGGIRPATANGLLARSGSYTEVDFSYKTKVTEDITLFAAYVYQNDKRDAVIDSTQAQPILFAKKDEVQNFVRFWARYNFN